jgi:hypothetical protein
MMRNRKEESQAARSHTPTCTVAVSPRHLRSRDIRTSPAPIGLTWAPERRGRFARAKGTEPLGEASCRAQQSSQDQGRDGHARERSKSDAKYGFHRRTNGCENRPKLRKHDYFPELTMDHKRLCPLRARHRVIWSGQEMGGR